MWSVYCLVSSVTFGTFGTSPAGAGTGHQPCPSRMGMRITELQEGPRKQVFYPPPLTQRRSVHFYLTKPRTPRLSLHKVTI